MPATVAIVCPRIPSMMIMFNFCRQVPAGTGWILDGFPSTIAQAKVRPSLPFFYCEIFVLQLEFQCHAIHYQQTLSAD